MTLVYAGAIGFAVPLAFPVLDHLRYGFQKWRLDHRLARDPYILREELRDYALAIGGEPEPLGRSLLVGICTALSFGIGAWAVELKMEDAWHAGGALFCALAAAWTLWRLLNEPDELLAEADPDNTPGAQRLWGWLGFGVALLGVWFAADHAGWL